jgi:hypothetical protein
MRNSRHVVIFGPPPCTQKIKNSKKKGIIYFHHDMLK